MSEKDELRRLLDERGVEWDRGRKDPGLTCWYAGEWRVNVKELASGKLLLRLSSTRHFTAEQAIAATMDGGECEVDGSYYDVNPVGLTISEDGNLLNWRGENYVKQSTLVERGRTMARNIQGNLGRNLYRRKDVETLQEARVMLMELANALDAEIDGMCKFEFNTDMSALRCSVCGYELPRGTNLGETRFCGGCGKAVKR